MHVACTSTSGAVACTLASSPNPAPFDPLFLHSVVHYWTGRSYKTRPSLHTARCGMQAVPLSVNFLCPTLDTAALLVSSSFVLRFTPLNATYCGSKTKLSGVLLPSTPMLCSTHSHRLSLFFGDVVTSSAMARVPVGFLTETIRQVEATGSQNRQEGITGYEHTATHTHTCCNNSSIPQRCVHYNPSGTMLNPMQRLI